MGKHNHKAIFTAVVLQQILGFVWYSPSFFFNIWVQGLGINPQDLNRGNPLPLVAAVLASVFFCYLLSWIFQVAVVEDWRDGLATGLLVGVGFLAPCLIMHYMSMAIRSEVIMVDAGREIVSSGMAGIILATWRAERTNETSKVKPL